MTKSPKTVLDTLFNVDDCPLFITAESLLYQRHQHFLSSHIVDVAIAIARQLHIIIECGDEIANCCL